MYHSGLRHTADAKAGFGFNTDMTPILWQPLYTAIYQNTTCAADPNLIARGMTTDAVVVFIIIQFSFVSVPSGRYFQA
jgi:hypothetical protein